MEFAMSPKERAKIKKTIKAELDDLRQEIEDLRKVSGPVSPDNAVGRLSRMDAIVNAGVNGRMLESALEKESLLEVSLENIDDPEFGTCASCGEAIAVARILALPETRLCIECASK
jgi:DnaK suppressor protein